MSVRIAPSILSADFARLADEITMCEAGGADWIHVDVMDGRFVPNLTFGAKMIETVRKLTDLPPDVHLMVIEPERYFDVFAAAGASVLTMHVEVSPHLHRQLCRVRELGCLAGVSLNPSTPLDAVREVAAELDVLLIMSVNPGFGGQSFMVSQLRKVERLRRMIDSAGLDIVLEVDGGVTPASARRCIEAGADALVAGTAVFRGDYAQNIQALRGDAA